MARNYLFQRIGLLLALLIVAGPARAAVINVTTTADSVVNNGACSLREALQNANSNAQIRADCPAGDPGNDTIQVQPGTIQLTLVGAGEDFAGSGDLDIRDDVTIVGFGPGTTIVDGLGADRVFHIVTQSKVIIRDLTISNGSSNQGSGVRMGAGATVILSGLDIRDNVSSLVGAGVANIDGDVEITTTFFGFNSASTTGGGLHSTGSTLISGSLFRSNDASTGGAIYSTGGSLTVVSTDFDQNSADSGGAISAVNNSTMKITGGTFSANQASSGAAAIFNTPWEMTGSDVRDNVSTGGAGAIRSRSNGTVDGVTFLRNTGVTGGAILHEIAELEVTSSTFRENEAGSGGAIDNRDEASLSDCEILSNTSTGSGGGIVNTGLLFLVRSTLDGNEAALNGGGLLGDGGQAFLRESAVTRNSVQGDGGGVMIDSLSTTVDLFNSTVSGNIAGGSGGGVFVHGLFRFDFTTIAANRANAGTGGAVYLDSGAIDLMNSLISDNTPSNCGGSGPGAGTVTSFGYNTSDDGTCMLSGVSDANNVDPELKLLADNGGPTETHAFLDTSPARDTAAPGCARLGGGFATFDQRVVTRPLEGDGIPVAECDRGAFEGANPFSIQPSPVGDGIIAPPLRASRNDSFPSDAADITWDVSTCISQDYHVLYGPLNSVSSYIVTGSVCDLGPGVGSTTIGLPAGSVWFIVVGDDDFDIEGSWGAATAGERNGSTVSGECGMTVRDNAGTCP